jgi:hypothetical protein
MTSLWQAIAIIMAVSVISLECGQGDRCAFDSADARDRVSGHGIRQHRFCNAFRSARSSSR